MTKLTQAYLLAEAAHYGQVDKGGAKYFYHVRHVSEQFYDELHEIVGILHDVIEDSPLTTLEGLRKVFGSEVADAVDAISRRKEESYSDYILRCKKNVVARAVKIQDLKHNMDKTRWPEMPDSYYERETHSLKILEEKWDSVNLKSIP